MAGLVVSVSEDTSLPRPLRRLRVAFANSVDVRRRRVA